MVRNTVSVNAKAAFKPPAPRTLASVCGVRSLQDMGMGKGTFKCDHPDKGDEHSNFGGDNVCVQAAKQPIASVHTLHMPRSVITSVFKVLRNRLPRGFFSMPKPTKTFVFTVLCKRLRRCIFFTHAQTGHAGRVHSGRQSDTVYTCLHMSTLVILFVFEVLCNRPLRRIHFTCLSL